MHPKLSWDRLQLLEGDREQWLESQGSFLALLSYVLYWRVFVKGSIAIISGLACTVLFCFSCYGYRAKSKMASCYTQKKRCSTTPRKIKAFFYPS